MIELVTLRREVSRSEARLDGGDEPSHARHRSKRSTRRDLRRKLSDTAGSPLILKTVTDERTLGLRAASAGRDASPSEDRRRPITSSAPSARPCSARDVAAYVARLPALLRRARAEGEGAQDHARPGSARWCSIPAFGLAAAGRTAKDAAHRREIYDHTIDVILRAEALGGFQALPAQDIFDVEYWDLEQAKLKKGGKPAALRRRGGARHRCGFGHRQGVRWRHSSRAAPRWSALDLDARHRVAARRARISSACAAT